MDTPDDYDSPWKDAVEHYFPEFIAFYFPDTQHHNHRLARLTPPITQRHTRLKGSPDSGDLGPFSIY